MYAFLVSFFLFPFAFGSSSRPYDYFSCSKSEDLTLKTIKKCESASAMFHGNPRPYLEDFLRSDGFKEIARDPQFQAVRYTRYTGHPLRELFLFDLKGTSKGAYLIFRYNIETEDDRLSTCLVEFVVWEEGVVEKQGAPSCFDPVSDSH